MVGGNITGVWTDFRQFAEADQDFFANLIDEHLFERTTTREPGAGVTGSSPLPVTTSQDDVLLEDLTLINADPAIAAARAVLKDTGISGEQFDRLQRSTPAKQATRKRTLLDDLVKTEMGKFFAKHGLKPVGRDLDKSRENFKVVESSIDLQIEELVPSGATSRSEYTAATWTP